MMHKKASCSTSKLIQKFSKAKGVGSTREFSAKPYIRWNKGHPDMEAHRKEMYQHPELFEGLDAAFTQQFSKAKSGTELRIAYKDPEFKKLTAQIIRTYCSTSDMTFEEGESYARNQAKMSARTYTRLNCPDGEEAGQEILDAIHRTAATECDFSTNIFGATLTEYRKKYGGDMQAMSDATKRHRPDAEMSKMLNREVDTSGKPLTSSSESAATDSATDPDSAADSTPTP